MDDFSALDIFFSMMWFYLVIAWLCFLFQLVGDVLRSRDLSGIQKAVWMVLLVFVPFFTAIAYLMVRGDKMQERQVQDTRAQEDSLRQRLGVAQSPADEISKLASLRDNGTITEAEFQTHKGLVLSS